MENKITAVEWLVANIDWLVLKNCPWQYEMLIEKAKTMEKEQIIESHEQAYIKMNMSFSAADRAEDFYEETYMK
jgi:hypothetical protein